MNARIAPILLGVSTGLAFALGGSADHRATLLSGGGFVLEASMTTPAQLKTAGGGFSLVGLIEPSPRRCGADIAEPFGVVDQSDLHRYLELFAANHPAADVTAPRGIVDGLDLRAFLLEFQAGCR